MRGDRHGGQLREPHVGATPRDSTTCTTSAVSSCGFDGKCDGMGGCSKYPMNTVCKAGTCDGDAVIGANVCDGIGHCKPGSTRICVPFSCNPGTGACYETCTTNNQCVSGQQCVSGSCGPQDEGSGLPESRGLRLRLLRRRRLLQRRLQRAVPQLQPHGPRGHLLAARRRRGRHAEDVHGHGPVDVRPERAVRRRRWLSEVPRDTMCKAPTCSGNRLNTAGTCNGLGTCSPPGIQNCNPFRCANGACSTTCTTNADCDVGIACVNGTCGPKQDGQSCRRRPSASTTIASTRSAVTRPARAPAAAARCRGPCSESARRLRPGRPIRGTSAR